MSKLPKKSRNRKQKTLGDHQKYISRITKTLYYGVFPKNEGLSLPVTELAAEIFSEAKRGRSLDRLHCDDAAKISRNACVSPCSMVLAILYLERLKKLNPEYLERTAPSDLFLVSLMVSCKFLYDDGESDEVFIDEWATSGEISVKQLVHLEKDFLKAIDWEVYINELTFWKKLTEIETALSQKQGNQRGFYTYTELNNLLTTIELHNFIQSLTAISVILVATYAAALLTLLGSVFIVSHIPGNYMQIDNHFGDNKVALPEFNESKSFIELHEENIESKTDCALKNEVKALNIFKTGMFLASIEGFLTPFCNGSNVSMDKNTQNITWDWWNVPTMKWLHESAKSVEKFELPKLSFNYIIHFLDSYVSKVKYLELGDHIHKATKTRIQDQIETSWHKEWTDTINGGFNFGDLKYYVQNIKS